jgi:hypothetical protein
LDTSVKPVQPKGEGHIPPTREALSEALKLSEEILRNLELSETSLTNIALKASRLARLLNDFEMHQILRYEASGYPTKADGVPPDTWKLAISAGRGFDYTDPITKEVGDRVFLESIGTLEAQTSSAELALTAAQDSDISISSANPHQFVHAPKGNVYERSNIRSAIQLASARLGSRRNLIYQYTSEKYYELKFSGIASDVFARIRERVDSGIGKTVPIAVQQFSAVYENLWSDNPEDWSNAVHSCRRILQSLADAVFPATEQERIKERGGKSFPIKLGKENYINRLVAFIEDASSSERFQDIVGSNLQFMGDRLDALFKAAQKGSHTTIINKEEADRYVVYTYLLVGDVLALASQGGGAKK